VKPLRFTKRSLPPTCLKSPILGKNFKKDSWGSKHPGKMWAPKSTLGSSFLETLEFPRKSSSTCLKSPVGGILKRISLGFQKPAGKIGCKFQNLGPPPWTPVGISQKGPSSQPVLKKSLCFWKEY